MPRRLVERHLVVASHNRGKVREIAELLASRGIVTESASARGLAEPEETAGSFAGNAALKALAAATAAGCPALADDSGLSVAALAGQPGILSARWAGPSRDFDLAMRRVHDAIVRLEEYRGHPVDRRARFVCALCIAWPDRHVETVEGEVRGHLVWPPLGDRGFGYDPIFVADGQDRTFGEIDPALKAAISHRADAFRKLQAMVSGAD